jgi:hypothetical protein
LTDYLQQLKERLDLEQARLREAQGINTEASVEGAAGFQVAGTGTTAPASDGSAGQKCNTCGGSFPDAASYRSHFK